MNSYIDKFFNALKLYKFGIFSITFNKLFSSYFKFQTFLIYNHDLEKEKIKAPPGKAPVTIKKLTSPQGELFKKFRKKYPAKEFVSRLNQQNRECYVALKNDNVVGYGWIAYEQLLIESINYLYKINSNELFIYSCYVSKENRGEGIYPEMLYRILKESSESNCQRALIGVLSGNTGSIRGIEKAGFKSYDSLRYLKIGNSERWRSIKEGESEELNSNFMLTSKIRKS